jgi:hypothetical protein
MFRVIFLKFQNENEISENIKIKLLQTADVVMVYISIFKLRTESRLSEIEI